MRGPRTCYARPTHKLCAMAAAYILMTIGLYTAYLMRTFFDVPSLYFRMFTPRCGRLMGLPSMV